MRQAESLRSIRWQGRRAAIAAIAVALAACQSSAHSDRNGRSNQPPPQAQANVAQDTETAAIGQATAYAQRLQSLVTASSSRDVEQQTSAPRPPRQPIQWIDIRPPASPPAAASQAPPPSPATQEQKPHEPEPEKLEKPTTQEPNLSLDACDRQMLLEALTRRLRSGSEPALRRAAAAVGLTLADPSLELSEADLEPLDPSQRQLVQRFARLVRELAEGLEKGQTEPAVNQVRQFLEEWAGPRPIRIRTLQLCRRVRGFGVYETLGTDSFLAGRSHRIILYLELENFRSQPTAATDGTPVFQVRLQQQVRLFHAADGLEVWRLEPVQIVDESRNQRHDFFVVQLVELPANLTVGRYLLKVRVEDAHGGSLDEATAMIHIVADPALTGRSLSAQAGNR